MKFFDNRALRPHFSKWSVLSLLCILYYLAVCFTIGRPLGIHCLWLIFGGFFAVYGHLSRQKRQGLLAGERMKKKRIALRCCTALLSVSLICAAAAETAILSAIVRTPAPEADYVIVLGAKVNGTQPSLSLNYRIQSAAAYLRDNPASLVVASGGQGSDELISEAEAIRNTLAAAGIHESRILLEDKSTSTEENLTFSLGLIQSDGGSADSSVVIVTSDFHMYRALRLASKLGYGNVTGKTAPSMVGLLPQNHLREILAICFHSAAGTL